MWAKTLKFDKTGKKQDSIVNKGKKLSRGKRNNKQELTGY